MLIPFSREEGVLNQKPFLNYEVQFNIFHRIFEGKEVVALKTKDDNVIALHNPGNGMWIWINEVLEQLEINNIINALCHKLKNSNICGVAGQPEMVKRIAEEYSKLFGISCKISMGMESYQCSEVITPQNVQGKLIKAEPCHVDTVAEYCAAFALDGHGEIVTKESQISSAVRLINSGNMVLWVVNNKVVSIANIAHRSMRHARINSVYTAVNQRKKGYASALMAELSSMLLIEGLIPMLYADVKNPDSNKVYKSIGYKSCGRIDEITFIY
jgi:predicted GNAT family acetyltransferase